ncbi:MAG: glycosyl hydrolase, partial [Candidatus Hydrogenedentota bacterium]
MILSCVKPSEDYIKLYNAKPYAPGMSVDDIKNLLYLGAKPTGNGVNFNIYSERAERVELLIFDDPDSEHPARVFEMSRFHNVWSVYVEGIGPGTYYGYRMWGPNWKYDPNWRPGKLDGFIADVDAYGNRFNPNKVLMDPYGRAFHRDHDWSKGMAASGPYRQESTVAASAKAIVLSDDYSWSSAEQDYWNQKKAGQTLKPEELIVYEVHLKGFTKNPGVDYPVDHPGTYRGAGEMADYLKDLGVNVVEFLPINEAGADGGYWKYWTIGFFAPEVSYAFNTSRGYHVNEFRQMVEEFHKRGIEVWIDIVFNHSGEGGLWREKPPQFTGVLDLNDPANFWIYDPVETATILTFRGIDNNAYYQRPYNDPNAAAAGYYWEHTGVGNGMRANHTPFRRLIIDALRYWNDKMHVDGFRFDLCAQLGEIDEDYGSWSSTTTVLQDIVNDPILQANNARVVAEPWDAGGHYKVGEFSKAADSSNWQGKSSSSQAYSWYEWNGQFRDYMRSFLNDDSYKLNTKPWPYLVDGGGFLTGSGGMYNKENCSYCIARYPYNSINFITAHDGFTLYDVFSYAEKRNCGGPLNPNCIDPTSGDDNNHSKDWQPESFKRQIIRNAAVLLFLSNGTPMMLGGDEWMRTKYGNNNPYHIDADNPYNWMRWSIWKNEITDGIYARRKMHHFFKSIIAFRKENCWAFCHTDFSQLG